jgi:hypothetical protein
MALPIGTNVIVCKVGHLGTHRSQRLIGRKGVVVDHEDGMNLVKRLTKLDWLLGLWAFGDDDVAVALPDPN